MLFRPSDLARLKSDIQKLLPETCTLFRPSVVSISASGGAVQGAAQLLGQYACRVLPVDAQVTEEAGATPEAVDAMFHIDPAANVQAGDTITHAAGTFSVVGVIDRYPHTLKRVQARRLRDYADPPARVTSPLIIRVFDALGIDRADSPDPGDLLILNLDGEVTRFEWELNVLPEVVRGDVPITTFGFEIYGLFQPEGYAHAAAAAIGVRYGGKATVAVQQDDQDTWCCVVTPVEGHGWCADPIIDLDDGTPGAFTAGYE